MTTLELAKIAALAAREKKATRLVLQDLQGQSDLCDFQLICSGQNEKQTQAIADSIQGEFKKQAKISPSAIEGMQSGHWILLDFGSLMIHVFYDYIRDYYALEELWPKATFIQI
jgi:ribosome-associated protein